MSEAEDLVRDVYSRWNGGVREFDGDRMVTLRNLIGRDAAAEFAREAP